MDIIAANLVAAVDEVADELGEALGVTSTTVLLADVDAAINTDGKYVGKQVFNTTTNILVCAVGADADDVWANAGTGVTAHTPV